MKTLSYIIVALLITVSISAEVVEHIPKRQAWDYNKGTTLVDDSRMCWAYAVINTIKYILQDNLTNEQVENLFTNLYLKFGNEGMRILDVYKYVLLELFGMNPSSFYWSLDCTFKNDSSILRWIKGALLQNEVVLVAMWTKGADYAHDEGHVVTCYMYKYENGKRWLGVADSDDDKTGIYWKEVTLKDDKWYVAGYNMYIDAAYSLKLNK